MSAPRRARRNHMRLARKLGRDMRRYSDHELAVLAMSPADRKNMERVLATAEAALERLESSIVRSGLKIEADRLRKALENPGVLT